MRRSVLSSLVILALVASLNSSTLAAITGDGDVIPRDPNTWNVTTDATIGNTLIGTVTADGGSSLSSRSAVIGYNVGSSGVVSISRDATWTNFGSLWVGRAGEGILSISYGGRVTNTYGLIGVSDSSSHGFVEVIGPDSTWDNSDNLSVGQGNSASGSLSISDGGVVTNVVGYIGQLANSVGTVTVSGSGSAWNNSSYLYVGDYGSGYLTISNGGSVTNTWGYIGDYLGSTGSVEVSGLGSNWVNSSSLTVGYEGLGSLTISDGGRVTNVVGCVGRDAGSIGTVHVSGSDTTWFNDCPLHVGYNGSGIVTQNDGDVFIGGTLYLAYYAGSSGAYNLNGGKLTVEGLAAGEGAYALNLGGGTLAANIDFSTSINATLFSISTIDTQGHDIYWDGVLSGNGALSKAGTGALTLAGVNTYTGNTFVDGGTLIVNGSITSDVYVGSAGILQGAGTVARLTNSGTVAPGNSIGTMTVAGNYRQNPGATLEIEINDAGASDRLNITGDATIEGGRVLVLAESGNYTIGQTYTFLTADTVSGQFDAIAGGPFGFDPILMYNPDSIQFYLVSHYINQARTFNQRAVAGYLNDHVGTASGDFLTVLTELNTLYGDSARAAFDAMSGELYPSLSTIGIENTDRFLRSLAERLRSRNLGLAMAAGQGPLAIDKRGSNSGSIVFVNNSRGCAGSCWKPWAEGFGVGASIAGDGNASGLGYSVGGVTFGVENDLDENTLFGIVGGYSNTYAALNDRIDRAKINAGQVGAYLHRSNDLAYITGMTVFDYSSYDARREVTIGDIARTTDAGYGGNDFSFYTEIGRYYQIGAAHLQPYAALQYIQLHQNDFLENGAQSVDLSVGGVHADSFRGLLGSRPGSFLETKSGRLLSLEGRALWRHEFLDEARVLDATFAGQPGSAFVIKGVNVDRDAAILGCGTAYYLTKGAKLFADYDLLVSDNYTAHAGTGGFMYVW